MREFGATGDASLSSATPPWQRRWPCTRTVQRQIGICNAEVRQGGATVSGSYASEVACASVDSYSFSTTERILPAGSLNQAIFGPPLR